MYNNIESRNPQCTPRVLMAKRSDKKTIYFSFRLDIGINNFSDMDEFVSITKPMKGRESKIPTHPVRKNPKQGHLSVIDINYVTYSRKCV